MRTIPIERDLKAKTINALEHSPIFFGLTAEQLDQVVGSATLHQFETQDAVTIEGDPSEAVFVMLRGEASVRIATALPGEWMEVSRVRVSDTVGEVGVLLGQPRSATVVADGPVLALRFQADAFVAMFQAIPSVGLAMSRALAARLGHASRRVSLPESDVTPPPEVMRLLPIDFMQRHRVLVLKQVGNVLTLGFVDDPTPHVLAAARQMLPSMEFVPVRISGDRFDSVLQGLAGVESWASRPGPPTDTTATETPAMATGARSPRLDQILARIVAEGASDLHLSAGNRPRWRLDGEMQELTDTRVLGATEVAELLEPILPERNRAQFTADNDTDFAYALPGLARFRVNVFRDHRGVSAVFRQIPDRILTFEQLNLPAVTAALCENPKGLVLVTGPTGSGKSTTLAAMIDYINKRKKKHIITLEDPIEFVHESLLSLVNQREVGSHTGSFARALKAALREDPDIVLVGEMRDLETVSLALETANTGHLVFGTLHTSTATSTIDRIIGVFPAEQQAQIRAVTADVLKGVVAQTLCRKIGGGRVAALEILVANHAVSALIREGKTHQLATSLTTGKALGNQILNEELARLVTDKKVEFDEAFAKAVDKAEFAKRFGRGPTGAAL